MTAGQVNPSDHHQMPLRRTESRSPNTSLGHGQATVGGFPVDLELRACILLQIGGVIPDAPSQT